MLNKAVLTSCMLAFSLLSGCSSLNPFPEEQVATVGEVPSTHEELMSLPKPAGAIPVSVYSFRDQTGQYKPSDMTSSFSTAVTQGATSILMQALDDSSWFVPVEREGLQNVLTERKIIRAGNEAFNKRSKDKKLDDIPPLTSSKIILEGGIISYDSNIRTGGSGLAYYGISASEEYREDQISIYLRAVDVRSGRVLTSVNTTKKVLSQEMRAGLFRFVSFKELLEAEIGFTSNEPMHICVQQAIEKSVIELVKKGLEKKIWLSADDAIAQQQTQKEAQQKAQLAAQIAQEQKRATVVKVNPQPKPSLHLANAVYFESDESVLTAKATQELSQHAKYLVNNPDKKVLLEGHADERGTQEYNLELGKDRAIAAAQQLHRSGVSKEQLAVTSKGEEQPVNEDASYENNRRVEIKAIK